MDHVDAVHLGARADAPLLLSVALRDEVRPSTVFSAYNHYGSDRMTDKQIRVWSANRHEGGGAHQQREQLAWLADRVGWAVARARSRGRTWSATGSSP